MAAQERIQIAKAPIRRPAALPLDTRTPSGKKLPF